MTDWSYEACDPVFEDRPSLPRKIFIRTVPALAAFSFSAAVALRLAGGLAGQAAAPAPTAFPATAQGQSPAADPALAESAAAAVSHVALDSGPSKPALNQPRNPFGGLFDPETAAAMPAMAAQTDPVGPSFSPLQSEPLFVLVDVPETGSQLAESESNQQIADADRTSLKPGLPIETAQAEAPEQAAADSSAPLPPARPIELSSVARVAQEAAPRRELAPPSATPTRAAATRAQTGAYAQNDPRSFFDKLFSGNSEQKGPQLAYASQENSGGLFNLNHGGSASSVPVSASGGTAVYDISRHTVYLPGGAALEAHSGLGPYFDDPGHVHMRMRGSTPPATYKLTLRESLFHGVQAIRLTPLDSNVYGRAGLLAHTFMLGARGESNGCVSFRNYRAFLEAYMRGEIRQLKVVASR